MAARADRGVAAFLRFSTRASGPDATPVAVTADHGVAPIAAVAHRYEAAAFDSVGKPPRRVGAPAGVRPRRGRPGSAPRRGAGDQQRGHHDSTPNTLGRVAV